MKLSEVFIIKEAGAKISGVELNTAVPKNSPAELEQLFYCLRWVAGFCGGNLPTPELKEVFNALDAVSPARVTGESHEWGSVGREFGDALKAGKTNKQSEPSPGTNTSGGKPDTRSDSDRYSSLFGKR